MAAVMLPIKLGTARRLGLRDPQRPEAEYARYPQRIVLGLDPASIDPDLMWAFKDAIRQQTLVIPTSDAPSDRPRLRG
jgi:hypothetical protein